MVFSGKCWVGLCLLVFFLFSVPSAVNVGVEVVTVSVAAVIPCCAHHRVIGVTIAVLLLVATLASFVLCGCGIDADAVTNQIFVLVSCSPQAAPFFANEQGQRSTYTRLDFHRFSAPSLCPSIVFSTGTQRPCS